MEIKQALCLDLDGTVRYSKSGRFIENPDDIVLYPGIEEKLWTYHNEDWLILGFTNQGGVAFGFKTRGDVELELKRTGDLFDNNPFHQIYSDLSHPQGTVSPFNKRSLMRKPYYGMLAAAEIEWEMKWDIIIDWDNSLFVGDRPEDQGCAANAKIPFMWAWDFFERERDDFNSVYPPGLTK